MTATVSILRLLYLLTTYFLPDAQSKEGFIMNAFEIIFIIILLALIVGIPLFGVVLAIVLGVFSFKGARTAKKMADLKLKQMEIKTRKLEEKNRIPASFVSFSFFWFFSFCLFFLFPHSKFPLSPKDLVATLKTRLCWNWQTSVT